VQDLAVAVEQRDVRGAIASTDLGVGRNARPESIAEPACVARRTDRSRWPRG
jgi:hypothetical protein